MKKVLLVLGMVALTFSMNAQETYKDYSKGETQLVIKEGKSQGTMYMDLGDIGLILNAKDREKYGIFLTESYAKFSEWKEVALENEVKELTKEIKKISVPSYFKYGSKWCFSTANMNTSIYIVDGEIRMYAYIGKMKASANQFMVSKSELTFLTEDDIKEILEVMNEEEINAFLNKTNSTEDLFKN
tara:strand:+ start:84 stop:641 length:558 start_codon:yes stop_codon:yes gene_type:complete